MRLCMALLAWRVFTFAANSILKFSQTEVSSQENIMTTQFNGTEFVNTNTNTFAPTFEGAQARREIAKGSLIKRRNSRTDRRANRAI